MSQVFETHTPTTVMAGRKSRPSKNAPAGRSRARRGCPPVCVHGSPGLTPGDDRRGGNPLHFPNFAYEI